MLFTEAKLNCKVGLFLPNQLTCTSVRVFPAASLWCIQMRNISSPLFCPFCFLLFSMGFWWKALWHYICVMAFQSIAHSVSLAVRPRDSDDLVLVLSKQHCIAFGLHVILSLAWFLSLRKWDSIFILKPIIQHLLHPRSRVRNDCYSC